MKKQKVVKRADGSILIINYEQFSKLISSSGEGESGSSAMASSSGGSSQQENRTSQSSSGASNSQNLSGQGQGAFIGSQNDSGPNSENSPNFQSGINVDLA